MSTGHSPTVIASPALHPSVPTRTPVATRRSGHPNDPLQRQPSRCNHAALAHGHALEFGSVVVIRAVITARGMPRPQIPIARRRS
jgi:hypothetical protein